eukprot:CAMPEP_0179474180 /NCGR_PEP_ID=MMETSP0799-20121207/53710_1 /TAXON_ID=46947 /ORGANISM="Geminigera cryophila, Strain CCMP2564" /LENGTH=203 /DNA_ID=CAMNT_0021283133 /DNA_START=54 /DNA_END=661 /DNA_ORIENTATION=+
MERRKAQYRALPSHQATTARKKNPVHTSMKIEPLSSRDRNMALASKVGVKDATQVRPPETERIKTANSGVSSSQDRTVEEAGDTNDDDRTILQRRKASNDPEQQADEHDTIDAFAIKALPVNEGTGGEWAEEGNDEFQVHTFLERLIEICVEECLSKEQRRTDGTGKQVRIDTVAFMAKKQKGVEQKFSAISTLLRLTGLVGR